MTSSSSSPSKPFPSWKSTLVTILKNISDESDHPVRIALRTYSLSVSLLLGPVLLPVIFASAVGHPNTFRQRAKVFWRALARELRPTGFASAITAAIGGGAALQRVWVLLERRYRYTHHPARVPGLSLFQRTFLTNVVTSTLALALLRWKRRRRSGTPPTLDLTLLLLVRALDASVQALLFGKAREITARQVPEVLVPNGIASPSSGLPITPPETRFLDKRREDFVREWKNKVAMHLDALVFWVSSARIMWCFFYQPQRLPPSYVKWINSLANVDKRLLEVLRALREGTWSYIHGSPSEYNFLGPLAENLGCSPAWGDPTALSAYGGSLADEAWELLGVVGRRGVGGLPCKLVHGGVGTRFGLQDSCIGNATIRAIYGFAEALLVYLPVHFLPVLLTKPSSLVRPHHALPVLLSAIRSATFLSTFLSSYWFAVCFTRTLVLARLFPQVSHDVWDGPYGGTLVGSLVCGMSIWIENAGRRGEMAIYVLPKALRASISEKWLHTRYPVVQFTERLTFILSLALLLTFSVHQPESLRGLSRWTLAFVMKGSNVAFRKKRRKGITTCPDTKVDSCR